MHTYFSGLEEFHHFGKSEKKRVIHYVSQRGFIALKILGEASFWPANQNSRFFLSIVLFNIDESYGHPYQAFTKYHCEQLL
jgi:hypothetical protein